MPFLLENGDEPQVKLVREYLDILILVPPEVVYHLKMAESQSRFITTCMKP